MRIALVMPQDNQFVAWSMGRGLQQTLERLGFSVLAVTLPTIREASKAQFELAKKQAPTMEDIQKCNAVIVSGPEHVGPWVDECYGQYDWLHFDVPKAAWLHESCEREDYNIDFGSIQWMANTWFFPAIQDAEKHDQEMFAPGRSHFLPFGVDTHIFRHPSHLGNRSGGRKYDVAFIGLLYPKRVSYLTALSRFDHPPIRLANVGIQDIDGYNNEESVARYAENLRSIKTFFNLPAMSKLLVTKIYEVMAAGTLLLTPMLGNEGGSGKNMAAFESGKHLIFYRANNVAHVAKLLRDFCSKEFEEERERIAAEGCREVHERHSLEARVQEMLAKMGLRVPVN